VAPATAFQCGSPWAVEQTSGYLAFMMQRHRVQWEDTVHARRRELMSLMQPAPTTRALQLGRAMKAGSSISMQALCVPCSVPTLSRLATPLLALGSSNSRSSAPAGRPVASSGIKGHCLRCLQSMYKAVNRAFRS
jgi:hypothetical protein